MLKDEVALKLEELIAPLKGDSRRILEIGTGWAESATFFSKLKPLWKIYTIDCFGLYGDRRIIKAYQPSYVYALTEKIRKLGNVIQILGNSHTIPWELPIDVLYIDGDHRFVGCLIDFKNYAHWVTPGGLVIFDDYTQVNNKTNGVAQVVDSIIKEDNRYTLIYKGYYCAIFKKKYNYDQPYGPPQLDRLEDKSEKLP